MIRNIIWHKELFIFNFLRLSEDNVSKLEKTDQSISIPSILGCKQQRIASVWSSMMQRRVWILTKIAWHCPFNYDIIFDQTEKKSAFDNGNKMKRKRHALSVIFLFEHGFIWVFLYLYTLYVYLSANKRFVETPFSERETCLQYCMQPLLLFPHIRGPST